MWYWRCVCRWNKNKWRIWFSVRTKLGRLDWFWTTATWKPKSDTSLNVLKRANKMYKLTQDSLTYFHFSHGRETTFADVRSLRTSELPEWDQLRAATSALSFTHQSTQTACQLSHIDSHRRQALHQTSHFRHRLRPACRKLATNLQQIFLKHYTM